ncbi:hypothetical protein VC83_02664 [Pseudogymnoascus destructans]|uniref:HMG box domain-containing protein n=2 Tax=Pseudogymnoascus destructans TaxID=655981 RepID=L8FR06_PSED2|nr:uncharacterized protein VC83_02664 [Pseudogymnoascus destructans]ELR02908.1 hypothetical protein GMDG_01130 [Pseudogymnoascus destructans 20631-21]OAF60770.1 hypothetical protein VC83_02664 [Pseudogymnoascus destructans]
MFSAIGRAAIGRIRGGRSTARVPQQIQRVQITQSGKNALQSDFHRRALVILSSKRLYSASTTKPTKPASDKPAKKRASTTTKKAVKKPAAKKAKKVLTGKQQEKKEADAIKVKIQAQKKKEADAIKVKVQAQRKKDRKVVEDEKAKIRELKAKVLTPPKKLPATAWTVLNSESVSQHPGLPMADLVKDSSARYKTLDPSTRETYNQKANANKATNDASYESWLASLSPQQIYDSNHAQQRLKHLGLIKQGKHLKIDDPRIPKRPLPAYIHFVKERYASGDFKGISPVEAAKVLTQEYKALSESEKKLYEDLAVAERERYAKEMTSTFGTTRPVASSVSS